VDSEPHFDVKLKAIRDKKGGLFGLQRNGKSPEWIGRKVADEGEQGGESRDKSESGIGLPARNRRLRAIDGVVEDGRVNPQTEALAPREFAHPDGVLFELDLPLNSRRDRLLVQYGRLFCHEHAVILPTLRRCYLTTQ
jgi:hypothetical protein